VCVMTVAWREREEDESVRSLLKRPRHRLHVMETVRVA
jgi:hypothetical protein